MKSSPHRQNTFTSYLFPLTSSLLPPAYGLIGYPLGHSFSPAFFREKFRREGMEATYTAFELPRIDDLPALLDAHPDLQGLNVTIPYKETVLPFLHEVHPDAAAIGAVNCIRIRDGRLTGYNTDWKAFADCLDAASEGAPSYRQALVLGTGGASKAVCFALDRLGIPYMRISRNPGENWLSYEQLTDGLVARADLVVNTTPLGMHPALGATPPLPGGLFRPGVLLFDLIYNPPLTRFLERGQAAGARIQNGQRMLELQAEASWGIWQEA